MYEEKKEKLEKELQNAIDVNNNSQQVILRIQGALTLIDELIEDETKELKDK